MGPPGPLGLRALQHALPAAAQGALRRQGSQYPRQQDILAGRPGRDIIRPRPPGLQAQGGVNEKYPGR